jgi:hypothetical protein
VGVIAMAGAFAAFTGGRLSVPTSLNGLLGDAARVTGGIEKLTQGMFSDLCPKAFGNQSGRLTSRAARDCLRRAENDYLGILRKAGVDNSAMSGGRSEARRVRGAP